MGTTEHWHCFSVTPRYRVGIVIVKREWSKKQGGVK